MISFVAVLAMFLQPAPEVGVRPPSSRKAPSIRFSECRCPDQDETAFVILEGLVIDAEVTLSADGLSPADRQATIFNINGSNASLKGRTKIWHSTKEKQCGVNFDYGKKYAVAARRTEQGFETDACLMRRLRAEEE